MPIAERLKTWLEQHQAEYATLPHAFTPSSARTAEAAHIPGGRVAKAVVLKTPDDHFLLMVLPADYLVHLGRLHRLLGEEVCLASEDELTALFPDCAQGAVPVLGEVYGLRTLVDSSLFDQPVVYFESGDHCTLIQLSHHQFARLMLNAERVEAVKHVSVQRAWPSDEQSPVRH